MKKRFTRILAALALLVFTMPSLVAWGQSTVTFNATTDITQNAQAYQTGVLEINAADESVWTATGYGATANTNIVIGKGGANYLRTPEVEGTITSVAVTWSGNTSYYLALQTTTGDELEAKSNPSTSTTETFTVSGSYNQLQLVGRRSSGTSNAAATITNVVVTYNPGSVPQPTTYTVTYDANGGTGTMTDSDSPYNAGATVTVLDNEFTRDGYTFNKWNTAPDGTGTDYDEGDTFTINANTTLYAQWTENSSGGDGTATYTITSTTSVSSSGAPAGSSATFNNTYANNKFQLTSGNSMTLTLSGYQGKTVTGIVLRMHSNKSAGAGWMYAKAGATTLASIGSDGNGVAFNNDQWYGAYSQDFVDVEISMTNTTYPIQENENFVIFIKATTNSLFCESFTIYYESASSNPTITFDPNPITLGSIPVGQPVSKTFSVSQANLTSGISLSANLGGLNVSNIEQGAAATQVTWNYTPNAAGAINATITATSGTFSETLNITGTAKAAHNITVATTTNGSVTASSNSAIEGETITLTVTPSAGYKLEDLTVTNTSTEEQVTVTNNTFEMPNADVTVNATFTAIQTLTVAEALDSSNEYPLNEVYVSGIISQIVEVNTSYHNATYYISDDGTQNNELYVFRGKNLGNTDFNSTNDILVGDQVVVFGNVIDYQGTIEFATNNYIYSRIPAAHYTINFYVNGQMDNGLQMSILQSPNAVLGTLPTPAASSIPAGYEFYGWMVKTANEYYNATTAPEIVDANTSVSGDMDLAAVFRIGTTEGGWTLSNTAPEADEEVILATLSSDKYYAFFADGNGASATEITVSDNVITNAPQTVWTCSDGSTTVSGTVYNGLGFSREGVNGYLHFNSGAIKVAGGYGNGLFEFSAISGTSAFTMYGFLNDRYLTYNNSFGVSAESDDACPVYVFKFVGGETTYSDYTTRVFTLPITGYGTSTGGYYLIASPVSTTPAAGGMITDELGAQATPETATYDLYSFDQAQELEWINYRQGEFDLVPGKGYLYANKNNVTLTFAGVPSTTSTATLSLSGNGEFAGWNLVGNPFSVPAYIGTRAYYRIGNGGANIVAATPGTAIDVMEGVFVIAAQAGEQLAFSTTAAKGASVAMNVVRERGNVIDRAIVRFDEGDQLPKFQLNPNNTKIYVTEGNKDYAVVRSAAEAEMPVSFRASENGTYTLAVEAENVEMNYLHLIDNLTGMDVDLLQTPSYTFEAKTTDYASRFRLVFSANSIDEQNAETFAYFNGTNWTVSNVGDATLQVVDVTGRTVANQLINGNAELNLNQPAGVYVIRLVNGDNVKTQKVVVR